MIMMHFELLQFIYKQFPLHIDIFEEDGNLAKIEYLFCYWQNISFKFFLNVKAYSIRNAWYQPGSLQWKIAVSVNWALKHAVNNLTETTCMMGLVYKISVPLSVALVSQVWANVSAMFVTENKWFSIISK